MSKVLNSSVVFLNILVLMWYLKGYLTILMHVTVIENGYIFN